MKKKKKEPKPLPSCDLCFNEGGAYGPCRQCGRRAEDENNDLG